jgi:hypothetical protein
MLILLIERSYLYLQCVHSDIKCVVEGKAVLMQAVITSILAYDEVHIRMHGADVWYDQGHEVNALAVHKPT